MVARFALLGCLLGATACLGHRDAGPAWPQLHAREVDGGESLAPRPKTQTAAAVASSDDKTPAVTAVATAAAPATAAGSATPAAAGSAAVAPTDEITTEEMVIEVDE